MISIRFAALGSCTSLKRVIVDNDADKARITGLLNDDALADKIITKAKAKDLQQLFVNKRIATTASELRDSLRAKKAETTRVPFPLRTARKISSFLGPHDQLSLIKALKGRNDVELPDEPVITKSITLEEHKELLDGYKPFQTTTSSTLMAPTITGLTTSSEPSANAGAGDPSPGAGAGTIAR